MNALDEIEAIRQRGLCENCEQPLGRGYFESMARTPEGTMTLVFLCLDCHSDNFEAIVTDRGWVEQIVAERRAQAGGGQ